MIVRWIVAIAAALSLLAATPARADYHADSHLRAAHATAPTAHAPAPCVVPTTIAIAPPARTPIEIERSRPPKVTAAELVAERSRGPPRR